MTTEHLEIPIAKIATHPRNPRRAVGDVTELAASIREHGLLQDLVVAHWPDDAGAKAPRSAEYVLIAGHRRHAALKKAALKTAPVKVRADLTTSAQQLEAMLVENLQRADLTPVEEAHAYQGLLDLGLNAKAIADSTGLAQKRVRERLKLTRIPETVQDLTHSGQITLADALIFDEFRTDEKALAELAMEVGTDNFRWAVNRLRRARDNEKAFRARVKGLRDAGVTEWTKEQLKALGDGAWDWAVSCHGVSIYEYGGTTADREAAETHGSCPGHGFIVMDNGYVPLRYVCTKPGEHVRPGTQTPGGEEAGAPGPSSSPGLTPEQEAAEAARQQLEADLAAAATTRGEHLAGVITAGPSDELAKDCLVRSIIAGDEDGGPCATDPQAYDFLRRVLTDLPQVEGVSSYSSEAAAQREAALRTVLERLTVNQLAVVLDLSLHGYHEDGLTIGSPAQGSWDSGEPGPAWLDRLHTAYGYRLSTFEADTVTAHATDEQDGDAA